jgi:hypothetical protein
MANSRTTIKQKITQSLSHIDVIGSNMVYVASMMEDHHPDLAYSVYLFNESLLKVATLLQDIDRMI